MYLSFQINSDSLTEFLSHWSSKYQYSSEEKYDKNIGNPLNKQSRLELFEWKNGSIISAPKLKSIEKNYPLTFEGNHTQRYLNEKESGGAIWNIFYLHCLAPTIWPIYDQHTYRAMTFIKTGKNVEIGKTKKEIYKSYKNEYIPFLKELGSIEYRELDKALFAFGQFLKIATKYI